MDQLLGFKKDFDFKGILNLKEAQAKKGVEEAEVKKDSTIKDS